MPTDINIRNLKPRDKLYKVADREGLYVASMAYAGRALTEPERRSPLSLDPPERYTVRQLALALDHAAALPVRNYG